MHARHLSHGVIAAAVISIIGSAQAQWTPDPAANLPIGDKSGEQVQAKIRVNLADGGCYIGWFDNNAGGYDVYLQRLDDKGREQWAHNGVLVADRSFSSTQGWSLDVSTSGDALLAFRDDRFTGIQITAARVTPDGTLAWGANGVQLTSTADFVAAPKIASTTDGAIVVAWTQNSTVRLQKLDASGAAQWGAGLTLTDEGGGNYSASDLHGSDAGSVILSWNREPDFNGAKHIYAQKFSADGSALWGAAPVVVFDGGSLQFGNFPTFVPDGGGGAVFGWYSNSPSLQCSAQRIAANGSEVFPHNGVAGSTQAGQLRVSPSVDYDPVTGDTYLFWTELNGNQSQHGVYGQKFDASGARQWTDNGLVVVPVGAVEHTQVRTLALGAGNGAMVLFVDKPSPPFGQRMRASRVNADGSFAWSPAIGDVSSLVASKSRLDARLGPGGTALLAWQDERNGAADVYAQNVNADGSLGLVADIDGDGDVDFQDLLLLLAAWGDCPAEGDCPADIDGDGAVTFTDLLFLLANWF